MVGAHVRIGGVKVLPTALLFAAVTLGGSASSPARPAAPNTPTAPAAFESSIEPLSAKVRSQLTKGGYWSRGCPVGLGDLRVLSISYRGFDKRSHRGQVIVNKSAAAPLRRVFRRLYALHFPIRYMRLNDVYTRNPKHDASGSFECRQAVPSPCSGGKGTGSWSNHAYGLAVDINPTENPYIGCGASYSPEGAKYRDRSPRRPGMITPRVVKAFRSIGWGWGGSWAGATKDYMHFSVNGR